jgi:bifunctional non-homologous end joining protein LigD
MSTQNSTTKTVTLFNRIPPKSAIYVAAIVARDGGHVVTYQNARIGATLPAPKDKTTPLSLEAAEKFFTKLVAEKMRGGYQPEEDAPAASSDVATIASEIAERQTGILPQLLNEIEEGTDAQYIADDAYGAEEKFDGKRIMLQHCAGRVTAINRKGLSCGISAAFVADALALAGRAGDFIIDGEAVGDTFHAFDLLALDGDDLRGRPFVLRRFALSGLLADAASNIQLSRLAITRAGKQGLYDRLVAERREGIVFKRLDAPYTAGRPARGGSQLKSKFTASATFIVAKRNQQRSVGLALLDSAGGSVAVGNVTIPANHAIPEVGSLVEVRYLYAYEGGSVYQPVYLGERDDVERGDCLTSQLKFKSADADRVAA